MNSYCCFRYLAAKCFVKSKQWQAALEMLEKSGQESIGMKKATDTEHIDGIPDDKVMNDTKQ